MRSRYLWPRLLLLPTESWDFWVDIGGRCGAVLLSPERTPPSSCPAAWCQLHWLGNPSLSLSNPTGLLCMAIRCVLLPSARNRLRKSKNTTSRFWSCWWVYASISGNPLWLVLCCWWTCYYLVLNGTSWDLAIFIRHCLRRNGSIYLMLF
jgi:hypothetical protein